jgi:hypothetical protein
MNYASIVPVYVKRLKMYTPTMMRIPRKDWNSIVTGIF